MKKLGSAAVGLLKNDPYSIVRLVPGFGFYVRTTVANGVHSGNGRTAAADDNTDYYPVPLKQETLRPGARWHAFAVAVSGQTAGQTRRLTRLTWP